MEDARKTKEQLVEELVALRARVAELESLDSAKLRLSRTMLRSVLDTSSTVVYVKDLDGRYLFVNRRYSELFHIANEKIAGKTDYDIFPEDSARAFQQKDGKAVAFGGPIEEEELVPHDNGIHTYISVKAPLYNEQGEPFATCGISTDITDRKRIEEDLHHTRDRLERLVEVCTDDLKSANEVLSDEVEEHASSRERLAESEKKFRALAESTSAQISIVQGDRFLYANRAFLEYAGIEWEELTKRNPIAMLEPQALAAAQKAMVEARESGKPGFRFEFQDRNGLWLHVSCLQAEVEGRTALISTTVDITEYKKALEALVESEARYRAVSETSGTSMILADDKTIITFANSEFERTTGYDRSEVEGKMSWTALFDAESRERMKRYHNLRNKNPGLAPSTYEAVLIDRHLGRHPGVINVSIIPGTTTRVASFTDMTEWNEIKKLAEVREVQLRQADRLATIGTLVSGVAHEINNPNNYISLNASILRKMWDDVEPILAERYEAGGDFPLGGISYSRAHDRVVQLLDALGEGSTRIAKIVEALKDFARKDTDLLDEQVDVSEVVTSALLILENLISEHTHRLEVRLVNGGVPAVTGSAQQLEQVLVNLISNACQALTNREEAVFVSTSFDEQAGQVVIAVRDEGQGLPSEALEHAMEPFYTTKRDTGGTGLGLSISSNIVRNHGGELTLISKPGEGCCATVRLPVADSEVREATNDG